MDLWIFNHPLSLLGFWALIVVYTHIGTHHLLQVPVPTWLKVVAIVDSVAMVIPVMAFLINIWYTAKGKLGEIHADIGAKFVFTGTIMYFFVSIQGSLMALPDVQRVTHFNNWVVAHAHLGVLGFAGMISLGGLYYTHGQYAQAETFYKRALAIREKALGPDHPDVATGLENLAALYRATKRDKEAETLEQRAARIRAIQR